MEKRFFSIDGLFSEHANTEYNWKTVIRSILSAAFGVQSQSARERDFAQGKPIHFILGATVFVLTFIALVLFTVWLVLP